MAALFIADKAYLQGPLRRPGGNEMPKGKAFEKSWRKLQWKPGGGGGSPQKVCLSLAVAK